MRSCLVVVLLSITLIFSCSKETQDTYTIEMIDGVKHIKNHVPLWGDKQKVGLEFVQQIGELDGTDNNYLFFRPFDVFRHKNGNLYITDSGNYRIQIFDPDGKYLRTIGRKGQGPGEFEFRPAYIDSDSKGNMYIAMEHSRKKFQIIRENGEFGIRFDLSQTGFWFRVSSSGEIFLSYSNAPITYNNDNQPVREYTTYDFLVGVFDSQGNLKKEIGNPFDFGDHNVSRLANSNYIDIDADDNLYVLFQNKNIIDRYSKIGNLELRIEYPAELDKAYKIGRRKSSVPGSDWEFEFPDFPNYAHNIGIDNKDRIWIMTTENSKIEDSVAKYIYNFTIFDNEGVLLGKIPAPDVIGWMRIFQDRLYIIEPMTKMCIYEYRIVEK
ncbi:6-bladed beta-propeller [candidate division KSB1 bacterium]